MNKIKRIKLKQHGVCLYIAKINVIKDIYFLNLDQYGNSLCHLYVEAEPRKKPKLLQTIGKNIKLVEKGKVLFESIVGQVEASMTEDKKIIVKLYAEQKLYEKK